MTLQVGVKAVLQNSEGAFLVLKRSDTYKSAAGSWDIVGGRIDPGTSLRENLAREIQEETGLTLVGTPRLLAAQDILREEKHIVRLTYSAQAEGAVVLDGVEHTEYRYVTFAELCTLEPLDVYVRELIDSGVLQEHSVSDV